MKRLVLLDYDAESMHSDHRDPEAKAWFEQTVLTEPPIVHSNEIGDEIGTIEPLPDQLARDLMNLIEDARMQRDLHPNSSWRVFLAEGGERLRAAAELDDE